MGDGAGVRARRAKAWTAEALAASLPLCALACLGCAFFLLPFLALVAVFESRSEGGRSAGIRARWWTMAEQCSTLLFQGVAALCMVALWPLLLARRRALWALAELSLLSPASVRCGRMWVSAGLNPYSAVAWALDRDEARARAMAAAGGLTPLFNVDGTLKLCLMADPDLIAWAREPRGLLWALNFRGAPWISPWDAAERAARDGLGVGALDVVGPWLARARAADERAAISEAADAAEPARAAQSRRL